MTGGNAIRIAIGENAPLLSRLMPDEELCASAKRVAKTGRMVTFSNVWVRIRSNSPPQIREGHEVLGHGICAMIECALFPRDPQ